VLPDGLAERSYSHQAVAEPLIACGLGYDVLPCRWSDFLADREVPASLIHRAVTEERLLYEEPALRRIGTSDKGFRSFILAP
jgi:hypothetical protein